MAAVGPPAKDGVRAPVAHAFRPRVVVTFVATAGAHVMVIVIVFDYCALFDRVVSIVLFAHGFFIINKKLIAETDELDAVAVGCATTTDRTRCRIR